MRIEIDQRGLLIEFVVPNMAACEAIPSVNCYHFTDGAVLGQLMPMKTLDQLLAIFGIPSGGCTPISQIGSGAPEVDEIYINTADPLVVAAGGCGNLASDVANHSIVLAVPFMAQKITPGAISVEDLSVAVAHDALTNPAN